MTLKPGTNVIYNEDGGYAVVEILEDNCDSEKYAYKLKIIGVLAQPRIGGPYELGEVLEPWRLTNCGYGGMWHIRSFEEFANAVR